MWFPLSLDAGLTVAALKLFRSFPRTRRNVQTIPRRRESRGAGQTGTRPLFGPPIRELCKARTLDGRGSG